MTRGKKFLDEMYRHKGALSLFADLLLCCDVAIVGGAVRTVLTDYKTPIKDFDICVIVIDREMFKEIVESYHVVINSFGGYKFKLDSIDFDVWELQQDSFEELSFSANINFDGIVYDYMRDILYAEPFFDCVNNKTVKVLNNKFANEEKGFDYNKKKAEKIQKLWRFDIDMEG